VKVLLPHTSVGQAKASMGTVAWRSAGMGGPGRCDLLTLCKFPAIHQEVECS